MVPSTVMPWNEAMLSTDEINCDSSPRQQNDRAHQLALGQMADELHAVHARHVQVAASACATAADVQTHAVASSGTSFSLTGTT